MIELSQLETVKQYVKTGGFLLFSTCTLTKEENEDNVHWFENQSAFNLVKEKTLYPAPNGLTDGFYMALFQKEE